MIREWLYFFPVKCEMAIFFIANRDLVSSRKPLFSKTIFREMRNKRLIPRETLF